MDDSSLDDFFAKKDKSKKKSKSSKTIPAVDILEKADDPVKKEKKKKAKEKTQTTTDTTKDSTIGITEEEWKEIEEEKEKDYSGLRIANLQVTEKETEESEEQTVENVEEEDEDGEGKKRDTGQQGPWSLVDGVPQPIVKVVAPKPVVSEPQPEEAPKEESKPVGKYVPPSQRGAAATATGGATSGPTIPAHLRRKKNAPNLRSEEDFPTLGGGFAPIQQDSDPRSFERVQHGGRQTEESAKSAQQLSLGNKFSALQD